MSQVIHNNKLESVCCPTTGLSANAQEGPMNMKMQQPVRILLAEDSSPDAYLFEESLRRTGMIVEIDHCRDGEECIRKIASYPGTTPPDLCVIDLHLPHVDGLQLVETIRANPSFAHTPLIVLTSSFS